MSRINLGRAGITRDDIINAIEQFKMQISEQTFNKDRESVMYDLVYEGDNYPPKYIVELAYNLKNPSNTIGASRQNTDTYIKLLKKLGFEVSQKDISNSELESFIVNFLKQSATSDQTTKRYNNYEYNDSVISASFGKGNKAIIPWMAFLSNGQTVSKGIYPVLLYNTSTDEIVIAYGVSETNTPSISWPEEIYNKTQISSLKWQRYNSSYIFSHYTNISNMDRAILANKLMLDIKELTSYYKTIFKEDPISTTKKQFFWSNEYPNYWDDNYIIGTERSYSAYTEDGKKIRIFEDMQKARIGDLILSYEISPVQKVIALCEVVQPLATNENGDMVLEVKANEFFNQQPTLQELKADSQLSKSAIVKNRSGRFFELTEKEFNTVCEYTKPKKYEPYTLTDALKEVFIEKSDLERISALLAHKKNIILQGPPGVGKTFVAKRLAHLQMGKKDSNRVQMIQFHQSYAYEDFIQGYRPTKDGTFELSNGVFYRFCKRAQQNPKQDYFFIIDEINRGNLSKIFGELMMLIEHDKRGEEFAIPLTYSQNDSNLFYIPENVHIIGTMNTADRSLSIVDYALRRRFAFIDIKPNFNKAFNIFLTNNKIPKNTIDKIVSRIESLNNRIENDTNLGKGFKIGHSYFCNLIGANSSNSWYEQIIENEIGPMLFEYWFDDEDKAIKNIELLLE